MGASMIWFHVKIFHGFRWLDDWLPNDGGTNHLVIGSTDVRWCLVGIRVPAIQPWHADRETERRKKKKRKKRKKRKAQISNSDASRNNKQCISTIPNIDQKQYCNLLLKEEEEKIGINKLHIFTIIIHHTLVQHIQEYYIVVTVLIETNMFK